MPAERIRSSFVQELGRRERKKLATRRALEESAMRLFTEKGFAVAREFQLVSNDGVLIDRSLLRKRLDEFASEFEKMYKVYSRPPAPPAAPVANE